MNNRVSVTIGGRDYTLLTSEDDSYVQKTAAYVNEKIGELMAQAHLSLTDAAVMAAVNLADDYFKTLETSENLRSQLKEYLEEAARTKMELSETKRALLKLQNK